MRNVMEIEELDGRLKVWAAWCVKNNELNLGYPRASLFSLLEDTGGLAPHLLAAKQSGLPSNWIAEEMDKWVQKLTQRQPHLSKALRFFYLEKDCLKRAPEELGHSYATFKRHCDLGRYWLLGGIHERQK